ncbi:MAG: SpoIID/LytB domain-containing protein [bacterium]|nr:SpoIID/LytB domain-containing protein [bacterium]
MFPRKVIGSWLMVHGKKVLAVFFFLLLLATFYYLPSTIKADEIEDLQKQIDQLNHAREQSINATKPLEGQLTSLKIQLQQIQVRLQNLTYNITQKEKELQVREDKLVMQQALLNSRVRSYYIRSYLASPLMVILSTSSSGDLFRELSYRQAATREDQRIISSVTEDMLDLMVKKEKLEKDKASLAVLQVQVDKNADFLTGEIKKAKDYQSDLSSKISDLTAKQQAILAARSGQFTASIGDSEEADDYNASIKGFRESAPAGSYAVFSFGAYTHRKGMSQYGARGRAQGGQDYKAILRAYYGKEPVNKDTGGDIRVAGQGSVNFEEKYLYGIAEMPSSWHPEALKAQAVAARTYAYRYKVEGKEICITETCQVFSSSKADNPPQAWKDAVNTTRGQVIEDVVTYYASTHGVYVSTMGWDTTDGSGGSNFVDKSYEKIGGSPWVYKAWYRQGYSSSGDSCGRGNPWLSGEELADIINAAKYRDDRVTPVTTSCWGGNPYSHAELREKAGGPATVTSVRVVQGSGVTSEVVFQTDKGEIRLSGSDFKTAFNIRAPGRLSVPQSGFAFFNIEKK